MNFRSISKAKIVKRPKISEAIRAEIPPGDRALLEKFDALGINETIEHLHNDISRVTLGTDWTQDPVDVLTFIKYDVKLFDKANFHSLKR